MATLIKFSILKAIAKEYKLRTSIKAFHAISEITDDILAEACRRAKKENGVLLTEKHFRKLIIKTGKY